MKTTTTKQLRLYVPASLATDGILSSIKPLLRDKYKFFLHTLYLRRVMNRNLSRNEAVEINSQVFIKYVSTKNAKPIIDFWVAAGVVETNGSYQAGERSKAYRFTPAYCDETAIDVGFMEEKFEKKVRLLNQALAIGSLDPTKSQNAFLYFNLQELRVDATNALLAINRNVYAAGILNDKTALDKANLATIAVQTMSLGEYRMGRDAKGNRVHTNLTNCSKYLRKYFYLETGEALRNLDVSNSQPLFLCVLLKQHIKQMPADMLAYIEDCERGELYEKMMVAMSLNSLDKEARSAFKKRLFKCVFYGQNRSAARYQEWHVFTALYPSVAAFITQAKVTDYKLLSHRMQKAESALIIDTVIKQIADKHNPENFFATTIHDSIVTTEDKAGYVKELMVQAFRKVGLNVNINDESF